MKRKIDILKKNINHDIVLISAIRQENVKELMYQTYEMLKQAPKVEEIKDERTKLYTFEASGPDFEIEVLEDGYFEITGTKVKLIFERTDFQKDEAVKRFSRQLRSLGIDEALRAKGAKNGDTVRIYDFEFDFIE